MKWFNYDTCRSDERSRMPDTLEEWEVYVPKNRRTQFWLQTTVVGQSPESTVLAILDSEARTTLKCPWNCSTEDV